ncbi:inositol monophosphatase family protein [Ruegeria sp. HKCCD7559]|uniref:inositol monophosphatase family protein n=1 Tax=Ruegeria sp. HKCCD7559 TaxID=2683005 RepID=UPI001492F43E|nr:inositol monophosphatase family protein [Ruegeria sp. HKCCD7559]NOC45471.1 inositol monophosphatase [Ruegeria sp. HKCCD7559]
MVTPDALTEHAKKIADIASESAMHFFRGSLGIEFKQDESPVTQADKAVEAEVRTYLKQHFPGHGIFGEEHGQEAGDGRHMWVIDPIDGTRSFLSGHPLFGFLLAHLVDGRPRLGLVGMPALHETYLGVVGNGASLNGRPIEVSHTTRLDHSVLYVNEGDKIFCDHPDLFNRLMNAGQTRRFAYDCYPHALLASGHVDAVVDYDLQPYDYLALSPLITAAGGVMTDWHGHALALDSDGAVVSAATPELHAELLDLINAEK